jgi:signal transduction histidine kinase
MTQSGYVFLGLTGIVAALAAILAYAVLKFFEASRTTARHAGLGGTETAFMAAAVEEAVGKLKLQERAMKARAEASERLSSEIIASMTSGLLVVAQDGTVRTINPAGRSLLRLPHEEPTGHFRTVLGGSPPLADAIEECLETDRAIVRRTIVIDRPPGGHSHLGVTISPIREQGGALHGAICLFSDLSDVVELEEQLRIKDSLARVGELTAGIAHEFRNGLATIHGYGRMLDLERLPKDYQPYVMGIRQETESLAQVVTQFLNFAKPAELILASVGMQAILERAADDIRVEARARGGDVVISGEFGDVLGDEVLLKQAFSNLCRNGLEACAENGTVPRVQILGVRDPAQGVQRVTVRDNGPGIQASVAATMFRPFVTTKARGTGLGLALVQKIVVTHNGRVTAANSEEGGAKVEVTLPIGSREPGTTGRGAGAGGQGL